MATDNNKSKGRNESAMVTPRQALIYAAAEGWKGDGPSPWISPVANDDILAWAESHLSSSTHNRQVLLSAFEKLIQERLFFEIHKGLFNSPSFYCSFDANFLKEIPDGEEYADFWNDCVQRYDEEYGFKTWRILGLCAGQGSQGPSDAPWGPCLGSSCGWFEDNKEHCNHGLRFRIKGSDK